MLPLENNHILSIELNDDDVFAGQISSVQPGVNPAFIIPLWDGVESLVEFADDGFAKCHASGILRGVAEAVP